jgi:hypothetical protein
MSEIAASLRDKLTKEQGKELFSLYDQAIWIAADPLLDWEILHDQKIADLGGAQSLAVRQMLKLFNLFEYLDSWTDIADKGPFQKEALAHYSSNKLEQIDQVLELISITNEFKERYYKREPFSQPYFFRKLLNCHIFSGNCSTASSTAPVTYFQCLVPERDLSFSGLPSAPHPEMSSTSTHFSAMNAMTAKRDWRR